MDILDFNVPLGDNTLNFGAEEQNKYKVLAATVPVDFNIYHCIYLEATRLVEDSKNLLRYIKIRVKNKEDKLIIKSSTPFFQQKEAETVSLAVDVSSYNDSTIIIELHIEQFEDSLLNKGLTNFKLFVGK